MGTRQTKVKLNPKVYTIQTWHKAWTSVYTK